MTHLIDRKYLLCALTQTINQLDANCSYLSLGQNSIAQVMKELHDLIDIVRQTDTYSDGYVIVTMQGMGLDHLLAPAEGQF